MSWRKLKIRLKLALLFGGTVFAFLISTGIISSSLFFQNVRSEFDRLFIEKFNYLERHLEWNPNQGIYFRGNRDVGNVDVWKDDLSSKIYSHGPMEIPTTDLNKREFQITSSSRSGERFRILQKRISKFGQIFVLRSLVSEQRVWVRFWQFIQYQTIMYSIILVVVFLFSYFLAQRLLSPLNEIIRKVKVIEGSNLGKRLSILNPQDEIGELTIVLNRMLDRIEEAFLTLKRFTSDAAHELRTPLTIIKSKAELFLTNKDVRPQANETIESILEEAQHLERLINSLLFLARADSGRIELEFEKIDIFYLCQECVEVLEVLALEKNQELAIECDKSIFLNGDRTLLRQSLFGLIHNAIKFAPHNSKILVQVKRQHGQIEISVLDQGNVIPESERTKIFQRFYRADKARTRETGGQGLGLAIVEWIVRAHEGKASYVPKGDKGNEFCLQLPVTT